MKNYKTVIGAAVVGLTLAAVSTQAQLNLTGGTVVASSVNQELVGISSGDLGNNNGLVSSWVISGAASDTTGLIFVYQVVNNGSDAVDNAEFTGFNASQVIFSSAYSSLTGLSFGSSPTGAGGWSGSATIFGGTATWEAGDLNNGGAISDYLAVLTNVQIWGASTGEIQDSFSAEGGILAPVPEANTVVAGALMLLPLGIGAVRALRKERTA